MTSRVAGLIGVGVGGGLIFGLALGLQRISQKPTAPETKQTHFSVATPKQKERTKIKKRPKPKPRKRRANHQNLKPNLLSSLSGQAFGIDSLLDASTQDLRDQLGGDNKRMVMTSDSVDSLPTPLSPVRPQFPPRARSRGITGHVVLNLLISEQGRVERVTVIESEPAGVFDDAAIRAYRSQRFKPATYKGKPIAVSVDAPVRFNQT